jgi:diacylglycerol kinase family enzyme
MGVTLVHHPGAGEGEWTGERILVALREAGHDATIVEMDEEWEAALAQTDEMAVVAGGDGTVAAVAAELAGRQITLGILPTGSGNNIARSLGILAPLEEIIPRLKNARSSPLRLCNATGPWGERRFVESIGLGAIAHSVLELQEEKLDGDEKLVRGRDALVSAIEAQTPLAVTVAVDGEPVEGEFLLVEVMNLPMIGPNIRLVPDTELKGESLSVALLPVGERETMVRWLAEGGAGIAPLRRVQGRRVLLHGAPQPLRLEDKTRDWDGSRVEMEAEPHRIRVLRPGDHQ